MDEKLLARIREFCAVPGPEDGQPRRRRRRRPRIHDRKQRQLCGQVQRAIDLALGASTDPVLQGCWVVDVRPAPDIARLQVRVQTADSSPDAAALHASLVLATPWLRSEVASVIHRKKTPQLVLVWAGLDAD